MRAEFLEFFVQRETWRVGCDFKQHAAGLTEINGMKIIAIHHRRDVVAKIDEMLAPLELFGVVFRSKSNVMHRTGGDAARRGVGLTKQGNDPARRGLVRRGKANTNLRFVNQTVAEGFRK